MSLTICHVDDDSDEKEIFAEAIRSIDPTFKLIQFSDCTELVNSFANKQSYDLFFLDFRMGQINGLGCLNLVKSNVDYSTKPVMFFAGDTIDKSIDSAYEMGAHYFISKPNDFLEYPKIIGEIIRSQNWKVPQERPGRDQFERKISR
jgi:DNA-binding NtrC family response regulator